MLNLPKPVGSRANAVLSEKHQEGREGGEGRAKNWGDLHGFQGERDEETMP